MINDFKTKRFHDQLYESEIIRKKNSSHVITEDNTDRWYNIVRERPCDQIRSDQMIGGSR